MSLGCRVNRVESDLVATRLIEAGCSIVDSADADVVVVNTCAVTGEAQAKARKAVRHAHGLPQAPVVVACGCAASLFAEELLQAAPGTIVEPRKDRVAARVLEACGIDATDAVGGSYLALGPTPTGRMRPGIKIQDGCDNRCTFCIVWKARGPSRSLPSEQVVRAVRQACDRGAHEVVLTGINLGSYRAEAEDALGEGATLDVLLQLLLDATPVERLRLSSIEPPDVTEELLGVMQGSGGRVAPFLHVCLQSGCDGTLRRMGRAYDTAQFAAMVDAVRGHLPDVALQTDIIAGFPGETDSEFEQSLAFCNRMGFSRMHVFRYSKRPGTPAAEAEGQVEPRLVARRAQLLREASARMRDAYVRGLEGMRDKVLVLEPGRAVGAHQIEMGIDPRITPGSYPQVTLNLTQNNRLWANTEA